MRRTTTTTAIGTALAAALLAGCSNGDDGDADNGTDADTGGDPHVEGDQGVDEAIEEEEPQFTALEVGEPFGEAAWGVDNLDTEVLSDPIVTGTHVIGVQDRELRAWDADGQEAWSFTLPEDDSEPGYDDDLVVRQTSSETVAVVSETTTEGEGLDVDTSGVSVTLIDTTDGSTITETEVPGDENEAPELTGEGLAFVLPDGEGLAITPDGQEHEVTGFATQSGPPDHVEIETPVFTVGDVVFWATEDGDEENVGYETDSGWTTGDLSDEYMESSGVSAMTHHGQVIINDSWLVDAETGEFIDTLECAPSGADDTLTSSPSGEWSVGGGLRLGDGGHDCIGGDGQQDVGLSAVADDGTAFGTSQGDLVVVPPEGDEEVSELPEGADAPIGVLEGDLAVHWDGDGTVNVNPTD